MVNRAFNAGVIIIKFTKKNTKNRRKYFKYLHENQLLLILISHSSIKVAIPFSISDYFLFLITKPKFHQNEHFSTF